MLTNIHKDIHRSVLKHVTTSYTGDTFIEGSTQRKPDVPIVEVRMDGPWITSLSKGEVKCSFDVNLLISVSIEDSLYKISEISGELLEILFHDIEIKDAEDNVIGCAILDTNRRNKLQVNRYGLIDPHSELMQATVEVKFGVTLEV